MRLIETYLINIRNLQIEIIIIDNYYIIKYQKWEIHLNNKNQKSLKSLLKNKLNSFQEKSGN